MNMLRECMLVYLCTECVYIYVCMRMCIYVWVFVYIYMYMCFGVYVYVRDREREYSDFDSYFLFIPLIKLCKSLRVIITCFVRCVCIKQFYSSRVNRNFPSIMSVCEFCPS